MENGEGAFVEFENLLFDVTRSPWVTSSSGIIVLVLFFFEILYTSKKNCSTNKKSQVQDLTIRTYIKQYITRSLLVWTSYLMIEDRYSRPQRIKDNTIGT